jgi:hypothetical protein
MKKILLPLLLIINITMFGQSKNWFLSFSVAPTIGGPTNSIKNQLIQQGYNEASYFNFLGLEGKAEYPITAKSASLLVRGGRKISDRKSFYFTTGLSAKGSAEGFKNQGYTDFLGIFGGSYGGYIQVHYNVYQLTGGYLYSFPKSRVKIGFGPSIFLYQSSVSENSTNKQQNTSFVPGASGIVRLPIGKEKRLFGVELFFEGNIAPPAKSKAAKTESGFQAGNVNMMHANLGLAFSFRR